MTGHPLDVMRACLDGPAVHKRHVGECHRTVTPHETVERVKALMPAMGITRIADVTGLDRIGIPVVMVCRPNSRSVAVAQGKGLTLEAATASGLMESAETFHAENILAPLKFASHLDLSRSHKLIDIERLPSVADSQYREDLMMLWVEGFDLIGAKSRWLPYETVRANFTLPRPPGSGCFDASTNGLASGNHVLEAICHGICEVVERDATALWNRRDRVERDATRLKRETIDDIGCREVLQRLAAADFTTGLWETTSDTGVPAYFAVILDDCSDQAHIGVGAGCHPVRGIALLRALTEAVQVRTTYISGARDDLAPFEYGEAELTRRRDWALDLMNGPEAARDFRSTPDHVAETFNKDLAWLLDRLRATGIEQVVCVNLTRDDLGIPVVRTVIPGLEGPDDHGDYVPGRRARWLEGGP